MKTIVHLIRHAEVANPEHRVYAALPGYGLSERGWAQAQALADYLAERPLVAIWSSPLERALRTAEVVARGHRLPIRVEAALTEWRLADLWAGLVWEELPLHRPGQLEAYLANPLRLSFAPEGLDELAERVAGVAQMLSRLNGEVAVVSHQDPVQAARLRLTGAPLAKLNDDKPVHAEVITFRPGTPWQELSRWRPPEQEPFPP